MKLINDPLMHNQCSYWYTPKTNVYCECFIYCTSFTYGTMWNMSVMIWMLWLWSLSKTGLSKHWIMTERATTTSLKGIYEQYCSVYRVRPVERISRFIVILSFIVFWRKGFSLSDKENLTKYQVSNKIQYILNELWILRAVEWFWLQLNSNIFFVWTPVTDVAFSFGSL